MLCYFLSSVQFKCFKHILKFYIVFFVLVDINPLRHTNITVLSVSVVVFVLVSCGSAVKRKMVDAIVVLNGDLYLFFTQQHDPSSTRACLHLATRASSFSAAMLQRYMQIKICYHTLIM